MPLSAPLLAAAPLVVGLMTPALVGAAAEPQHPQHQQPARPSAVHAARTAARSEVVEHEAARGSAEQRRVLDYWTPARMASALPISMLGIADGGLLSGLGGKAGLTSAPDLSGARAKPATRRHQGAVPLAPTSGANWPTTGAVARTTGRVFLTLAGVDFVCSASTVKSANRDVVVTAGHCVKDGTGEWADNWTFVPGYREGGGRPYGQYAARRMFVAGQWSRSGDDSHDVGMVALTTWQGRHVADVAGAQEIAFDAKRGTQTYAFGYPADPPYDGERLIYCAGRLREDPYNQTHDQGLACDMTAGSSGGPWFTGFDPARGEGKIVSLSSFKYSNDQGTMYGPVFGDSAKALFATAEHA
ncbi:trypsin-like peptidase domain-containing protein [Nonomuraea sp. NPDC005983]|uniref:trypsin-like serine peptidase n=1 Tax=Nonomuraea sp. NPDC005983 TaxID=3155595 RepID=UPI0033A36448